MTTILQLPVRPSVAAQAFTVLLQGRRYRVDLGWNGRIQRWTISLASESSAIFSGRILATRADLLRAHLYREDVPRGLLSLVDVTGADREASFESLGAPDGHLLQFIEPAAVASAASTLGGSGSSTPPIPTD